MTADRYQPTGGEKETPAPHDIHQQTYAVSERRMVIGASLRGRSHAESGTPCQDYHLYAPLAGGWELLVLSDGAGSATFASRGSKANCTMAVRLLTEMITRNGWCERETLPTELEWHIEFRCVCGRMRRAYEEKVRDMADGALVTDFNATLLVCVVTPRGMLAGHIGDGRMGYMAQCGEWRSLMVPHKGEEANQTLFLQSAWDTARVPALRVSGVTVPETRVVPVVADAVVLMSDGCERAAWQCSLPDATGRYRDVNKPHPQFMRPLLQALLDEQGDRQRLLADILDHGTRACRTERDDKTMLVAMNTERQ